MIRQTGAVLVISLVILMAMTLIGVTAMQNTTQNERMANNARQRNLAFQAAEAGLRAGEAILTQAVLPPFDNTTFGIRQRLNIDKDIRTFWKEEYDWTQSQECIIPPMEDYIHQFQLGQNPSYVVEDMGYIMDSGGSVKFGKLTTKTYRITSRGTGGITDAIVILQTTFAR
jgi:type IV pilus assembly protein PilX